MRVLLLPAGSAGDVNPFAGLARALARRGHEVTVASNAHFHGLFDTPDISWVEIGDEDLFERAVRHPDLWRSDPASLRVVMRFAATHLEDVYVLVREFVRRPDTVVVAGVLALGARMARDTARFPLATVQLAPAALPSVEQPPHLPGSPLRPWMPRWLKAGLWAVMERYADRLCTEAMAFRDSLGLPPVRGLITRWANSPDCILGLFPDWFAPPPGDWPTQTRLTGFPLWDAEHDAPLPGDVSAWLDGLGDRPPLVFAPGSANAQAADFLAAAADACRRLGRPGALLSRYPAQVPEALPAGVRHFEWVALSRLLPRAAALVSHGGIGTVSQGLAAGIPQVVMPMAFDQFDNLQRLRRLGVARGLSRQRFEGGRLAALLEPLLDDRRLLATARECASRLHGEGDSLGRACGVVETLCNDFGARD